MAATLDSRMEFDHVIRVTPDGRVEDGPSDVWAPELHALSDKDGQHTAHTDADLDQQARDQGWELESGWTGQWSYGGPCMHPSEYIGGRLERHIRSTPGLWVAVVIEEDNGDADMWAVAYRECAA